MAEEHEPRTAIDAQTERLKQAVHDLAEQAHEHAYRIAEHGLTLGEQGQQLFTGGAADWEAPKVHPVWAPEVAYEARRLQAMGEATFMYEPLEQQLRDWHADGKPVIAPDDLGTHSDEPVIEARRGALTWVREAARRLRQDRGVEQEHEQGPSY